MHRSIGKFMLALLAVALIAPGWWTPDAGAGETDAAATAANDEKSKKKKKKRKDQPAPTEEAPVEVEHVGVFADNAFPPLIPDTEWHQDAWLRNDCLRCHETGVGAAPQIVHEGMAEILMQAMCRSCHVFIEGTPAPEPAAKTESKFNANAFPPMMPASGSHRSAWERDDCLFCHEEGNSGAPVVEHEGMPAVLLEAKCRSCHVQVRADEAAEGW